MRSKLLVIFSLLLLLIGCRIGIEQRRNWIRPIPFDKEKWSDDRGIGVEALWDVRPALARDLINNNKLIGKTKPEVISMLGDADDSSNIIRYELDVIWRENIDPIAIEYLKINFNSENKVEKAEIEFHKTGDW